jgi:hypothetical protein
MRLRAQEWISRHPEITQEKIVAPIVVVGMMRSGTTLLQRLLAADRFHCATGGRWWRSRPSSATSGSEREDPRIAISEKREATSRELAPELFAIHPMYAREPEEEIVFLSDAFLSHARSPAHMPEYRPGSTIRLRTGVRVSASDAAVPAVAEAARSGSGWRKRRPLSDGCSNPLRTLAISTRYGPSFPTCTSCTCTATPRDDSVGASLNATLHAMHADTWSHRVGAEWLMRWGGPTTVRWPPAPAGRRGGEMHRHRVRRRGRRSDRVGGRVYDALDRAD